MNKLNRYLFFLSLSLVMNYAHAQSTSIDASEQRLIDEQRINNQVINQATNEGNTANAEYYQVESAIGGAGSYNPGTENLTDADRQVRDNFVHHGYLQRAQAEGCEGLEKECSGMNVGNGMVQMLSKAYSMIVGMGGLGGELKLREGKGSEAGASEAGADAETPESDTPTNEDTADADSEKKEEKTRHDYCRYVAMVTEVGATFMEAESQKTLGMGSDIQSSDTSQKASLYKAARSHEDRAKSSKVQFYGWGATAACYAGMFATGAALDVNLGLKLGGSTLLAFFFQKEIDKHQNAADNVKKIADELPGKGDCNPISDRDCYCLQSETQNDPKYCQPGLHSRALAETTIRTACVNKQLEADPKCSCVVSDTCFNQEFMAMTSLSRLPPSVISSSSQALGNLSRGALTNGSVSNAGLSQLALARKTLRKVDDSFQNSPKLSAAQKLQAKEARAFGLTPGIATNLAATNLPASALAKAKARFSGRGPVTASYRPTRKSADKLWGFSKTRRRNSSKKSTASKGSKKKKRSPSGKIINFAKKAADKAEINQDRDKPIFDIISRRYQLSAFERLNIQ